MNEYYIAWWNLENLFDVEDSPQRPDWLQSTLKNELKGWTQAVLDTKLDQLAKIILQFNNGHGPDILGVAEVENEAVMGQLKARLQPLGRNYQVAYHDTSDKRGIDVAFIYDSDLFTFEMQFFHVILKRTATRDLFQVNFHTSTGRDFIVVGNHWPSRSGGQYESEPYRILAGETLSYWHERILEEKGKDVAVLFMGDFNDEPFNRSLTDYLLSTNSFNRAKNASNPYAYNLMWSLLGQAIGSLYYNNFPNLLDQFLVGGGFLDEDAPIQVKAGSVNVERFPEMTKPGDYPSPIKFGRPSSASDFNPNGFSDHFPISVVLTEKTN